MYEIKKTIGNPVAPEAGTTVDIDVIAVVIVETFNVPTHKGVDRIIRLVEFPPALNISNENPNVLVPGVDPAANCCSPTASYIKNLITNVTYHYTMLFKL
jgi:hypothetical protein